MTKPMLERYEQILSQDPTSTVFVELAKALLEKGEHQRAIEICKGGLSHHRDSVIGRVLWGKALINLGRPAEAMEQFDQAIAIDRDNPHAYNLIGEVLLHKGLYRSALPLLKKAVALQPNDARMKQWLEQTQRALAGGPPPVLTDPNPPPQENGNGAPAGRNEPTEVIRVAGDPRSPGKRPSGGPGAPPVLHPVDPFDAVVAAKGQPAPAPQDDVLRGMTAAFDQLSAQAVASGNQLGDPMDHMPTDVFLVPGGGPAPAPADPSAEPTVLPSPELLAEPAPAPAPAPARAAPAEAVSSGARPVPPRPSEQRGGRSSLLADIPDALPDFTASVELPKVELSTQATEALAKEYERELRQKLEQKVEKQRRSFFARNWIKLSFLFILVVAGATGAGLFLHTRQRNAGRDLDKTISDGKRAALQDTAVSYAEALALLQRAAEMDGSSVEVWAWTAYAQAMLAGEHGGGEAARAAAQAAAAKVPAGERYADLLKVVRYELADAAGREAQKKELISSAQVQSTTADSIGSSLLQELVARILFGSDQTKAALDRLEKALNLAPENVRALVALGNYYRAAGDYKKALASYGGHTAQLSPQHPERVLGAAESRLELAQELPEALAEVEALPAEVVSPPLRARKELIHGRVLSANGKHEQAISKLSEAVKAYRGDAYALSLALGEAYKNAGQMEAATRALEAALKLKDTVDAKEALGRVLLMRDREKDVLFRLPPSEDRKLSLVRGMALVRAGDPKRARLELAKTQQGGKFPSEAVIALALADAAEGQVDKAQEVLEKTLEATRRAKADVRVALGQVYWQRGALDKARAQFEEAVKEPVGYEAGCALGRLILSLGFPEQAVEPLLKSVARNGGHAESRLALGSALLALGRTADAVKQFEGWTQESPGNAVAHRLHARALYEQGSTKEADAASARAIKLDGSDAEAHRIRAAVLFARGDAKGAFGELERANKLNAKDPLTFCEIGLAFLRQSATDNAVKAFEAARREDAKSACGAIGRLYAKGGGPAAVKELAELQKGAPSHWDRAFAAAGLARVHLAAGRVKDARKAAEDAVALAPAQGRGYLWLGLVALRQKDEAKAKEALARALELEPAYAQVHLAYADTLAHGTDADVERAVAEYETYLKLGPGPDEARVKKLLPNLKKKLAAR